MSNDRKDNLKDLLYAYELGMLTDEDRRELELHLLENEQDFEDFKEFHDVITLMRQDSDVRRTIEEIAQEQADEDEVVESGQTRHWRRRWPALASILVIAILLILKPWQIEIHPTQEAIAEENRLAITMFENCVDPADNQGLGKIMANLLITDLSESRYLQVVSSQRLNDILKQVNRDITDLHDDQVAIQIARRVNAQWLLTGAILQTAPYYVITAQIVDVRSGDILQSERITGTPDEDIFTMVDKLTVQIKNELSLPMEALNEPDRRIADVTTHSQKAYFYYLEGVDYFNRFYKVEAIESFRKALENDPSFAMAYYAMGVAGRPEMYDSALKYIDNTSEQDRYWIRRAIAVRDGDPIKALREMEKFVERYPDHKEALYYLAQHQYAYGNYDSAAVLLHKTIEYDSLFQQAINLMAYTYYQLGFADSALAMIDIYIKQAPNDANPYDSRGDICSGNNMLDEAIASYEHALAIKPDYYASLTKLAMHYIYAGTYERADSCFRIMMNSDNADTRVMGRLYMAYSAVYSGRFGRALQQLHDNAAADRLEYGEERYPCFPLLTAVVHRQQGHLDSALTAMKKVMHINAKFYPHGLLFGKAFQVQLLAEAGDFAQAEKEAEVLKAYFDSTGKEPGDYHYVKAIIAYERGDLEGAIAEYEQVKFGQIMASPMHFILGKLYYETERLDKATAEFEEAIAHYTDWRLFWAPITVKSHYYLGLIYEQTDRREDAIAQYETFLEIWKNADPGIDEIDDARVRLKRLKARS
ncbi:MAG: tetratricopeptide repeat protein [candidate division Zixibacteria bacterium]|nr:tetratricopeptide repeat protein [candidate division Zixibacteria bacterium]